MNEIADNCSRAYVLLPNFTAAKSIVRCPACGECGSVALGGIAPGLTVSLAGRDFYQPPYQILECANCSLLYKSAVLADEALTAYYEHLDFTKWEIPGFFPNERAVLDILRLLPTNSKILDFGCSSGRLLAPLVRRYACYGVEINAAAAKVAEAKGLRILPSDDWIQSDELFDAIVLMDVFEHLSSPSTLLQQLTRHLKRGGVLIVGTGNADARACRLDPGQFWYFRNVEHLSMLSRQAASVLATDLELILDGWQELSHYDTSMRDQFVQHLRHTAYWQFQRGSELTKRLLSQVPWLNRAQHWQVAPAFTCSKDHVIATFRKREP